MPEGSIDETDIVSKGYLTTFFLDLDILRNNLVGYRSIILRLNIDTKQKDVDISKLKLDAQLTQSLISWSDAVRGSVERCQISYNALIDTIPNLKSDSLDGTYKNIISLSCPDVEEVANYTFEIHKCFIRGTLHETLNKMDNFYEQSSK